MAPSGGRRLAGRFVRDRPRPSVGATSRRRSSGTVARGCLGVERRHQPWSSCRPAGRPPVRVARHATSAVQGVRRSPRRRWIRLELHDGSDRGGRGIAVTPPIPCRRRKPNRAPPPDPAAADGHHRQCPSVRRRCRFALRAGQPCRRSRASPGRPGPGSPAAPRAGPRSSRGCGTARPPAAPVDRAEPPSEVDAHPGSRRRGYPRTPRGSIAERRSLARPATCAGRRSDAVGASAPSRQTRFASRLGSHQLSRREQESGRDASPRGPPPRTAARWAARAARPPSSACGARLPGAWADRRERLVPSERRRERRGSRRSAGARRHVSLFRPTHRGKHSVRSRDTVSPFSARHHPKVVADHSSARLTPDAGGRGITSAAGWSPATLGGQPAPPPTATRMSGARPPGSAAGRQSDQRGPPATSSGRPRIQGRGAGGPRSWPRS